MLGTLLQIDKTAPLARPEAVWLALGTVLMLLGTAYFLVKGWGVEDPEAREYYAVTILIPAIAAASYFTMFTGFGLKEVSIVGGPTLDIYWARYADWLFTTPLLLLDLALLADADRATVLALVGLDGFMIVTGLWATLENVFVWRYVGWLFSEIALLFILYYLFTVLTERAEAMGEDRAATFRTLRNLTIVLWFVYPIWWLLGTEGAQLISLFVETLGFMVLDVTAKVGFGFLLLRSRAIFGEGGAPEPSAVARAERGRVPAGEPAEDWTDTEVDYAAVVEGTVPEVKDAVENRSLDVERVLEAERLGDARVTLIEWLKRRLDAEAFNAGDRTNARFELYEDRGGRFRWRLRHRNGHIIADSGQGYASRRNARDGVGRIRRHVSEDTDAEFEVYEDDAGEFRWRLRHPNGNILADSGQGYASKQGAERGVASVERNAPGADAVAV